MGDAGRSFLLAPMGYSPIIELAEISTVPLKAGTPSCVATR
jgi:hypothetical protein